MSSSASAPTPAAEHPARPTAPVVAEHRSVVPAINRIVRPAADTPVAVERAALRRIRGSWSGRSWTAALPEDEAEVRQRLEALLGAPVRMDPALVELSAAMVEQVRAEGVVGAGAGAKGLLAHVALVRARATDPTAVAVALDALAGGAPEAEDNGGPNFMAPVIVLTATDHDQVLPVLASSMERARQLGDVFAHAAARIFGCPARAVRGDLADAIADGVEGLDASEAYGIALGLPWGCGYLAGAQLDAGDV
ncbi:MAG: hypothetical protein ACRD0U_10825, partial [Acidimicrobiales bacterium]